MSDSPEGKEAKALRSGQYVLNRFRLERILGRGGMAVVWLGFDHFLDEWVALKFLPEVVVRDAHSLAILSREVKEARRLTHPNIIRIHDLLLEENVAAISMNWVDGSTLSDLRAGRATPMLEVDELEPLMPQILSALEYAHTEARIVHRDLKPANLMVDKKGKIIITDFAIARSITDTTTRLTNQDNSGTLVYMSPQQIMGKNHHSNDYYSLGATFYDLLTGMPPFWTGNVTEQILKVQPPPIAERRKELEFSGKPVPEEWEMAIAACLEKDLEKRPSSPDDFLAILNRGDTRVVVADWRSEMEGDEEQGEWASEAEPPDSLSHERTLLETPVPWEPEKAQEESPAGGLTHEEAPRQRPLPRVSQHRQSFVEEASSEWGGGSGNSGDGERPRRSLRPEPEDRFPWGQVIGAAVLVVGLLAGVLLMNRGDTEASDRDGGTETETTPAQLEEQLRQAAVEIASGRFEAAELLLESALRNRETRFEARQLLAEMEAERERVVRLFQQTEMLSMQRRYAEAEGLLRELGESAFARTEMAYQFGRLEAMVVALGRNLPEGGVGGDQRRIVVVTGAEPIELVWIPAGSYRMGSDSEAHREEDERAFQVTLPRGFWMATTEVTQGQYAAVMGTNPSHFTAVGPRGPVEQVDWFDVMEFCGRLTEIQREEGELKDEAYFTLPTEAQWEYACRAGTTTPFAFGDSLGADQANFNGNFPYGTAAEGVFRESTTEVGSFSANGFGIHDMHGNVREWCLDWYGSYPPGARDEPTGPMVGTERVVRGGSWFNSARFCRSAERSSQEPTHEGDLLGFRIVLVPRGR